MLTDDFHKPLFDNLNNIYLFPASKTLFLIFTLNMILFVIIENVKRFILQGSRMGACGLPMFGIVPVVTSLAECSKILRITILGCVVEVSYGKNYLHRFWEFPILCACLGHITIVLNPTELTTVVSPLQDLHSYILPIRRISFLVFWSYRHRLFEHCYHSWGLLRLSRNHAMYIAIAIEI